MAMCRQMITRKYNCQYIYHFYVVVLVLRYIFEEMLNKLYQFSCVIKKTFNKSVGPQVNLPIAICARRYWPLIIHPPFNKELTGTAPPTPSLVLIHW